MTRFNIAVEAQVERDSVLGVRVLATELVNALVAAGLGGFTIRIVETSDDESVETELPAREASASARSADENNEDQR